MDVTVELTTNDGQAFRATVRPGHVALEPGHGDGEATLRGDLVTVVDSLAGRGPELDEVLNGDRVAREPLTWMRSRLLPAD